MNADTVELRTPLAPGDIDGLKVGDIVHLSGRIFTARDQAHMHVLAHGLPAGLDTRDLALYHCGPLVKPAGSGWEVLSAGPTTSMRMESLEPEFLRLSGARAIIGKGGMGQATLEALGEQGAVYLSITGGVGALAAARLGPALEVHLLDELGPVEAIWVFDANRLGPLVVSMDSRGNSLHGQVAGRTLARLHEILG